MDEKCGLEPCFLCHGWYREDGRKGLRHRDCEPLSDKDCGEWVMVKHEADDHRRCQPSSCDTAAFLSESVIPEGVAVATATRPFVVVSFRDWDVVVHGSYAGLAQAKPARTRVGRRLLGITNGDEWERLFMPKTVAVVVCRWGHAH